MLKSPSVSVKFGFPIGWKLIGQMKFSKANGRIHVNEFRSEVGMGESARQEGYSAS
jgi:hypothetical protein